MSRIAKK